MALLTGSNIYKNPKSNILYGAGNNTISNADIASYINAPGRTAAEVEGAALKYGVSADQIKNAMGKTPGFSDTVDKYLEGQGITRELAPVDKVPTVAAPTPVTAGRVTVGPKETVAGQMHDILQDPNNPLNVQAVTYGNQLANRKGVLNSSIAVSAAQDALYKNALPIASQDASTNYDANKTNVGNDLTAGMFNNDLNSRVGMFNAGTEKDIGINTQNRNTDVAINAQNRSMDYYIANMDADNKMAIAKVQAAANDSGIMGDLGKTYMNLYQQTAADPNISPEIKAQIFNNLKSSFEQSVGLLPSFESIAKNLSFGSASTSGGTSDNGSAGTGLLNGGSGTSTAASAPGAGSTPKEQKVISKVNTLGYQPEPYTLASVAAYERATGNKVDRTLVVPEQLMEDFKAQSANGYTNSYLSKDGTVKLRNDNAYDLPALLKMIGPKANIGDLQRLFIPVQPPGTMRTDSPMFYVWNTDLLNKMTA